eukprot:5462664-Prymnesium_polylepis.1
MDQAARGGQPTVHHVAHPQALPQHARGATQRAACAPPARRLRAHCVHPIRPPASGVAALHEAWGARMAVGHPGPLESTNLRFGTPFPPACTASPSLFLLFFSLSVASVFQSADRPMPRAAPLPGFDGLRHADAHRERRGGDRPRARPRSQQGDSAQGAQPDHPALRQGVRLLRVVCALHVRGRLSIRSCRGPAERG